MRPTGEDMVWNSRLTGRAWWKLPRRNEGNLACGSKWIAWIEYMALSSEAVNLFQPHKAIQLVKNISWVLITPFFSELLWRLSRTSKFIILLKVPIVVFLRLETSF